jgi:serine/threonine protein kinase
MLANEEDLTSLKIVDFGLSQKYDWSDDFRFCGTRIYMAPEIIKKQNQFVGKSVDIWAVGIIMYEVLTGGLHPLCTVSDSRESYEEKVRTTKGLKPHPSFSDLSRHLFQRLTEVKSSLRHTA